jgi:hypothetical protein
LVGAVDNLFDEMEQGRVVLIGFGVDGGDIGGFGYLEVFDELLQVEF